MKRWNLALAAACAVLAGALWVHWPAPPEDVVTAYRKLSQVEYRVLYITAAGYAEAEAHQGLVFHARGDGARSFEIHCKGVVVVEVENTPSRVLLRMPANALRRAPDVERLLQRFSYWLVPEQRPVQVVEPAWWEARLREVAWHVPRAQRCVFGGDGER